MDHMTGAEMAVARQLLGLSVQDLADIRGNSDTRSMRAQEAGKERVATATAETLHRLRREHDAILNPLLEGAENGTPIAIPRGASKGYPKGWWRAIGARLMDRYPDVMIQWH